MDDAKYQKTLSELERVERELGIEHALSTVRGAASMDADPRLRAREGILLVRLGRYGEAVEVLQPAEPSIVEEPDRSVVQTALAQALMKLGHVDEALAHIESVRAPGPRVPEVDRLHAQILDGMGRKADAIALLRDTLAQHPENPDIAAALAQDLASAGLADEGLQIAMAAAEHRTNHAPLLGALGLCLYGVGRYPESIGVLEEAARLDPKVKIWTQFAGQACMTLGDHHMAAHFFEAALALSHHRDDGHLHLQLGAAYLQLGCLDDAIAHTRKATELSPGASVPWLTLSTVLERAGREEEARAALVEALARPPVPEWGTELARRRGLVGTGEAS